MKTKTKTLYVRKKGIGKKFLYEIFVFDLGMSVFRNVMNFYVQDSSFNCFRKIYL